MKNIKTDILPYLPKFLFVSVLGVLLHFTYDWSGGNPIVGLFSATNESTWEHLKLLFFPMLILTIWQVFRAPDKSDTLLPARTFGVLLGMLFIVVAFSTLSGVFGALPGIANIIIYFAAVALSFFIENIFITYSTSSSKKNNYLPKTFISWAILFIFLAAFFIFTFIPPKLPLFISPV